MLTLFLKILPLSFASLNSPIILAITVFLLASADRPIRKVIAFLLGIMSVLAIATALGFWFGGDTSLGGKPILNSWEDLFFGTILIILAIRSFFFKSKDEQSNTMEKYQKLGFWGWFFAGFLMNLINFNAVVPYMLEIKIIDDTSMNLAIKILFDLFAFVMFMLPFFFPLGVYLISPKTASRIISPVSAWIAKYNRYIVGAIFAAFGAYLIYQGF